MVLGHSEEACGIFQKIPLNGVLVTGSLREPMTAFGGHAVFRSGTVAHLKVGLHWLGTVTFTGAWAV